jgi:hypothetical protein
MLPRLDVRRGAAAQIKKYNLTRFEQLANYAYPNLATPEIREEMRKAAAAQRKLAPTGPALLSDSERGCVSRLGGVAKK